MYKKITKVEVTTNRNGAMETETIQKNEASSTSHTSMRNLFSKVSLFLIAICLSAGACGQNQTIFSKLKQGAEQGDTLGLYVIGTVFYYGSEQAERILGINKLDVKVDRNYEQAVYWYKKAAYQGMVFAQSKLAFCYDEGYGVEKDKNTALYWYEKAINNNDTEFYSGFDRIMDEGAVEELKKAGYSSSRANISSSTNTTPSEKIEKVWVDHNVFQDNQKGMKIHVQFSVDHTNEQGNCVAWFYFSDGTALKDYNSRYSTTDGKVSVGRDYHTYDDNVIHWYKGTETFSDFVLFMPYDELHLAQGSHNLKFQIGIFDDRHNQLALSEYVNFTLNN